VGLNQIPLGFTPPTNGQVLKYNGTNWSPSADNTGFTLPYTNTLNSASTLISVTNSGTGGGITGITAGNATVAGIFGESTNASGGNGVWGRSNGAQGYGVWGTSTAGIGVVGETNNTINAAGQFSNTAAGGDALNIQGGLKVSGTAGNRAALQITASASNLVTMPLGEFTYNELEIDNANSNNNSTCMLFITPVFHSSSPFIGGGWVYGVTYDTTTNRWRIVKTGSGGPNSILVNERFNVMIIDF
jgi:hypothetical protein